MRTGRLEAGLPGPWRPLVCASVGLLLVAWNAAAWAAGPGASQGLWVSSWSTAQQLAPEVPPPPPPKQSPAPRAQAPNASPIPPIPHAVAAQTVRMVAHLSRGGRQLRVQLANAEGFSPVVIGAAHIARSARGVAIIAGTDRVLSFGGRSSVTIPPGAMVVSDAVDLPVAAEADVAVSLYVPREVHELTNHPLGLHTTYILNGDQTAAQNPAPLSENRSYFWLADVDVLAEPESAAIAAFGDSITDGYATTPDANRAWPTLLFERLRGIRGAAAPAVINLGISGNRVLHDGAGTSALGRFVPDVLGRPGIRWVVLLEGINDISFPAIPGTPAAERISAQDLIAGYRMLIAQAHLHGIRVMGATILPWEGVWTFTPSGEEIREQVNSWIRSPGTFDSVVDLDAATRDPAHPSRLRAEFDSGDHVHPNDAGNRAMAAAIDLNAFASQGAP